MLSVAEQPAAEIAEYIQRIRELEGQVNQLRDQLAWFKRQLFGRKSEKRLVEHADQANLFAELLASLGDQPPPPSSDSEQITYKRRKHTRRPDTDESDLRFDDEVPVEVIELPATVLTGEQADQYEIIDHKITRKLAQRQGSYVVLEYRRPVVKHIPSETLTEVPAPSGVFDRCLADVSFLAGLLVDKFVSHLPLYRQHQRLRAAGIRLSRSTLTRYVQQAIGLLVPVEAAQRRHVLQSKVLAMDETHCRTGPDGQGGMKRTWYWPIYGEDDEVCFTWTTTRGHSHIIAQLGEDYAGTVVCDGHSAYIAYANKHETVTLANCWAHLRRYFEKALDSEPEAANAALDYVAALYQVEARIRELDLADEDKKILRAKAARPLVDAFFAWCDTQCQRLDLTPKSRLAKALTYAMNREAMLRVYLDDPAVAIDTNHLERALRVIPMGRKSWLFNWTEIGAEHVGAIQSLLVTCRLHGVDPYTYLVDVLQRVGQHPGSDVEALTPRIWKTRFAAQPLRSDLSHAH